MADRDLKKITTRLTNVFESIYTLTNRAGLPIHTDFQRLPPRTGTDYYKYITKPISLHTIGRTVKRLHYRDAQSFIDDVAQITWNARHYNEPGSEIYNNALVLDKYLREVAIPKLAADPRIPDHASLHYPDLGPLEDYLAVARAGDEDTAGNSPFTRNDDDLDEDLATPVRYQASRFRPQEGAVRRGRPPIIDKPYELRIKLILKLFKRIRHPDDENHVLTLLFERLPDKNMPGYYETVAAPISLHEIKTKVRSRKYTDVQQFLDDLLLMIANAKLYWARDPARANDIYLFEKQAEETIEREMLRPDRDFVVATTLGAEMPRTPLDSVTVNGQPYKVGDWVLIRNPNDAHKPICGQIFRLWLTDGVQYTNVCWYIRPEQTCHRVDRLFYVNEVCKTGEYSDHRVEDIVAPCYVIFLTHYQKGDIPPALLPKGAEWFICEFRYNANTYAFNRIRTWKACLPDEIRHVDQPIVPINEPRKLIKYESPLRHMLSPGAADITSVAPTPGPNENGPPIVGAVFEKPPYYNDELGQCLTSPHVFPAPEYDDLTSGRKAYIFTPVSQLKNISGAGVYSSSGTRHVAASYTPSQMDSPVPYDSPAMRDTMTPVGFAKHARDPSYREATPTALPLAAGQHNSMSAYSAVLPGAVVSYTQKPEDEVAVFADISGRLVTCSGSAVWFRAPPLVVHQRVMTPVGHSAKYLAWKLKRGL